MVTLDISPEVVKSIAQADLGRRIASNGKSKESKDVEKQLSDQMVCCCVELFPPTTTYDVQVSLTGLLDVTDADC